MRRALFTVLALLAPAAARAESTLPPLPISPLVGPFASLPAYCAQVTAAQLSDEPGHAVTCELTARAIARGPVALAAGAGPILEARLFIADARDRHCQLGIRVQSGWFVLGNAVRCLGAGGPATLASTVLELGRVDVLRGGPKELRLRVRHSGSTEGADPDAFARYRQETTLVCGVGPSGTPACTPALVTAGSLEEHARGQRPVRSKHAATLAFGPNTLAVRSRTAPEVAAKLGMVVAPNLYALEFP